MSNLDMQGDEPSMESPTTPPVTDALRAEARANPGGWVYAIDPEFTGMENVPPEGIVGAWEVADDGELKPDFTPNPRHVPSPIARGWPVPMSKLERVLQLARAGHATGAQLDQEFAASEVYVFSRPEGGNYVVEAKDGGRLAYAFSDREKAAISSSSEISGMTGREFARSLPEDVRIGLNPGTEAAVVLEPADILKM